MILPIAIIGLLHVIGFSVAYIKKTDHYTDVIYALSFFIIAALMISEHPAPGMIHWVLVGCIGLWALRLAVFLGYRIRQWGKDRRFDEFRKHWSSLLRFWLLQYVSIILISLPFMIALTKADQSLTVLQMIGIVVFALGLMLESIADYQKYMFKKTAEGQHTFMRDGVWKWSRHPNYLGEWFVWVGVFLCCAPFLQGWEWISIISPIWMFILLRFISGGNLLEKSADKKYSSDPAYLDYKNNTGIFFPRLFS